MNEMANSNCVRLCGHELGDCYIWNTYSPGTRIIWKRMSHNAVGFVNYYPQKTCRMKETREHDDLSIKDIAKLSEH